MKRLTLENAEFGTQVQKTARDDAGIGLLVAAGQQHDERPPGFPRPGDNHFVAADNPFRRNIERAEGIARQKVGPGTASCRPAARRRSYSCPAARLHL